MSAITSVSQLLFNSRLCVRYHSRRREFFETLNLASNACAVVFGSAAMAALLKNAPDWAAAAAAAVTVVSAINLVVRSTYRAQAHHDLARRFLALERKAYSAQEEDIHALYGEKLDIEADEPPMLANLALMCHNEQVRAEGIGEERLIKLAWWQRALAQLADLPPQPVPPPRVAPQG